MKVHEKTEIHTTFSIYIRPEHRSLGLGKAMLSYLATVAIGRGCGRFEWSVLDWNKPAVEFYKKIGAEPMTEWTGQRLTGNALEKLAENFKKS